MKIKGIKWNRVYGNVDHEICIRAEGCGISVRKAA